MKQHNKVKSMTIAAMLCAIGIIIPMVAPKIVVEPFISFTLASHVPIFIAMFISPPVAMSVAVLTAMGFLFAGIFPPIIVLRAFTHLVFAAFGAYILKKNGKILLSIKSSILFALLIAVVHAIAEILVVSLFFWGSSSNFLSTLFIGIGLGTVIHSLVDFTIAVLIWKTLQLIITIPANAKVRRK